MEHGLMTSAEPLMRAPAVLARNLFLPLPLALLLTGSLTACSVLPGLPDKNAFERDAIQDRQSVTEWNGQPDATADELTRLNSGSHAAVLESLLADDVLHQLIRQSLAANPGLQQTLLTLKIRQSEYKATSASQLPEVDAGFSAGRGENSGNQYSGEVSVSWELDLWGKLADDSSAAANTVAQQQALLQSARDSLVAEVMSGWLNLIQLGNAIEVQAQLLRVLRTNEASILQRYRSGLGNLDDLDSARTTLASAEATQADNQYQLAAARRSLYNLLGLTAQTAPADIRLLLESAPLVYPTVLLPLADLPQQTLARRPDLLAAWHAIEAANDNARVAYKDMLPSLSISAALTDTAVTPSQALFNNPVWSLLAQLTAPLYRGGALQAASEQAQLKAASSYQAYRETLLTAVTEVDNALDQERSLARQQAAIERALASARNNEARYLRRYRSGLADLLDLLSVQQSRYALESQLNSLMYSRLNNRIQLGLALGLQGTEI
jgi:outer membrane protein TolC